VKPLTRATWLAYLTSSDYPNTSRKVSKGIPVTGRGGPWGCEMLRFPHFLDNRLINGGEVVSLTRRPPFTPRNVPGTHFC
jgi:hypothetical protein